LYRLGEVRESPVSKHSHLAPISNRARRRKYRIFVHAEHDEWRSIVVADEMRRASS